VRLKLLAAFVRNRGRVLGQISLRGLGCRFDG
jgi:hypothetical protein